jgi:hypothetical protein
MPENLLPEHEKPWQVAPQGSFTLSGISSYVLQYISFN